jgi:hypothetical protein
MSNMDAPQRTDDISARAADVFNRIVKPKLKPEDHGKFVAVDVNTGEFEIDASDLAAVTRLNARLPNARAWLERAGFPAAHWFRRPR